MRSSKRRTRDKAETSRKKESTEYVKVYISKEIYDRLVILLEKEGRLVTLLKEQVHTKPDNLISRFLTVITWCLEDEEVCNKHVYEAIRLGLIRNVVRKVSPYFDGSVQKRQQQQQHAQKSLEEIMKEDLRAIKEFLGEEE